MRVLVTGSSGQLARAIQRTWSGHELILPPEAELNLADEQAILRVVRGVRPDAVINAAAFTAVDAAESDPERAMLVNGTAVAWLAYVCEEVGATLVQVSTDYVFDGTATRPYTEDDRPNPRTVYGRTKLEGERAAARASRHLIVRTAWLYDAWGKNFLLTMLEMARQGKPLRVVDDQRGCPTSCRALARQLQAAVEDGWRGLVHATCSGQTTWYRFAEAIFRMSGVCADLAPCATADFPRPAPRPGYSVLDGGRRKSFGRDLMPDWDEALAEVLADIR